MCRSSSSLRVFVIKFHLCAGSVKNISLQRTSWSSTFCTNEAAFLDLAIRTCGFYRRNPHFLGSLLWCTYSQSRSLGFFSGAGGWGREVKWKIFPFSSRKNWFWRIKLVVKKLLYLLSEGPALCGLFCTWIWKIVLHAAYRCIFRRVCHPHVVRTTLRVLKSPS